MTLHELNTADESVGGAALLRCCGSTRWVDRVIAGRPYEVDTLMAAADSIWWSLQESDWLQAFSAHPQIGDHSENRSWSSTEQSGVNAADPAILERLTQANQQYRERFGWIYIVNATGKTALEMLAILEARLANRPEQELRIAGGEQAKITASRLQKLLNE